VNRFIDHLQVVATNNYNTIADFYTTNQSMLSSQSAFTSRCLVTKVLQLLQLNCSTNLLQDNSSARTTQKTVPLLL
jgi:hypothetical protein